MCAHVQMDTVNMCMQMHVVHMAHAEHALQIARVQDVYTYVYPRQIIMDTLGKTTKTHQRDTLVYTHVIRKQKHR